MLSNIDGYPTFLTRKSPAFTTPDVVALDAMYTYHCKPVVPAGIFTGGEDIRCRPTMFPASWKTESLLTPSTLGSTIFVRGLRNYPIPRRRTLMRWRWNSRLQAVRIRMWCSHRQCLQTHKAIPCSRSLTSSDPHPQQIAAWSERQAVAVP